MKNYKLIIAYDGTDFLGWQKTKDGPSIEASVQAPLEKILQDKITLQAASRTDRGVHAENQVLNFFTKKNLPSDPLYTLNRLLPPSISIKKIEEVPPSFHPTVDAKGKEYLYRIATKRHHLPFDRNFCWFYPYDLDISSMRTAADHLIGTHDFSSFCNMITIQSDEKTRTIENITIDTSQHQILITIRGHSFLYKMVRNIVGTLAYVGCGKLSSDSVKSILLSKDRRYAGITAPAQGLTLKKIIY